MPTYLPFDPNPRRPAKLPPPRSCDSQFHVLGPLEKYPVRPGAAYQMPSATWEAALRVHKAFGPDIGHLLRMQAAYEAAKISKRSKAIKVKRYVAKAA